MKAAIAASIDCGSRRPERKTPWPRRIGIRSLTSGTKRPGDWNSATKKRIADEPTSIAATRIGNARRRLRPSRRRAGVPAFSLPPCTLLAAAARDGLALVERLLVFARGISGHGGARETRRVESTTAV